MSNMLSNVIIKIKTLAENIDISDYKLVLAKIELLSVETADL